MHLQEVDGVQVSNNTLTLPVQTTTANFPDVIKYAYNNFIVVGMNKNISGIPSNSFSVNLIGKVFVSTIHKYILL